MFWDAGSNEHHHDAKVAFLSSSVLLLGGGGVSCGVGLRLGALWYIG